MLKIENIAYGYTDKQVLQGINLEVPKGSIRGILGMNGAGKTTLFNVIYGMLKAQKGQISFDSKPMLREDIAYLETHNYFYSYMRAKEYLEICAGKNTGFNIEEWNQLFQLPLDYLIDTYSTGMKKKLAIMGVLAQDRPIMILDEPFNGVDLESNEIIFQILIRLRKAGKLILLSSHIMETLTKVCDEISYLFEGEFQQTFQQAEFEAMEESLRSQLIQKTGDQLDQLIDY